MFDLALIGAHLNFSANPGPIFVDSAEHTETVQCRAPAIVQAYHSFSTPLIGTNMRIGNTGIGQQHYLKLAAASTASRAADRGINEISYL